MNHIFHERVDGVFWEKLYLKKAPELIQISNFKCVIKELFIAENELSHLQVICFHCQAVFGSLTVEINCNDIDKFNPSEYDARFYIVPGKHTHELFILYMRQLMAEMPLKKKVLIDKLGHMLLDGHHVYVAGKKLLGFDTDICDIYFSPKLPPYIVEYDSNATKAEAFECFSNFCAIEKGHSEFIGLHALQSYLEPIYNEARIPHGGTLFEAGDTQNKKTTLVQLGTTLYNMSEKHPVNTIRFDSTIVAIQKHLSDLRTSCAIVDDFFKNNANMRSQTNTFQTIMRQMADTSIRKTSNSEIDITHTHLFITSEVLPDNISDLGRMQVLLLTHSVDSNLLTPIQEQQGKLIAFYVHFIDWAYRNYSTILNISRMELTKFHCERKNISCKWSRLYEHAFVDKLTLRIMLEYADSYQLLTSEEADKISSAFIEVIDAQLKNQSDIMEQVAKRSGEENLNIPRAIWYLIENNVIADEGRGSKCFFHYVQGVECLWITTEYLQFILQNIFDFELTVKNLLKYLRSINALVVDESGNKNTKRSDQRRYAVIRLDMIEAHMYSTATRYEKYMT